ncbi:plasmid mobilization relaxosome protein MobC [Enterococcus avium]|uniref:Plasmid mobilization relaxosome protein MobC n=1 Tax=Enterococcus avium TaxID=33945 RepID=A0AAW8SFJ9_ENTAV|nr:MULTISPECIES: plasmid mobilization relaxosome protein MobC [Enterococcus]MDT2401766.1 plasmid mobilization relaxosome protein MobC [Enterococcus avium]MDT2434208.1 plasmid mobilization relaxosome protein MobC [Enterococcus avium]MDT2466106.1 plasmid mobilization relaxosome protein MobC [Enterococcus avium]MDT2484053.1 plasmid mobilization relaxosome protein MobC [Enterococcus avium]MDT2505532.1 plasmid mobilization relaxosome protein MobC [Enterococcus avium]
MGKNKNRKRKHRREVAFSEEENSYIDKKIDQSPYDNFQNFARIMLITGEIVHVDYSELRTLNQEVGRIGNNVNQMARLANQFEEISPDDIQMLLNDVRSLQMMVTAALKKEMQREK